MTICIGALAQDGEAVVVAADRMVTATSPLYVEFEHHSPKVKKLTDTCVALTAGDALAHTELFSLTDKTLKKDCKDTQQADVHQIINAIKSAYLERRKERILDEALKLRGFSTLDEFYASGKDRLPGDLFYTVDRHIVKYDLDLSIIVADLDEDGGHVYGVENPGTHRCYDSLGYHVIGSGVQHALASFLSHSYTSACPLNKAVYIVYEAKKYAQSAPGVGEATDLLILTKGGTKQVSEKELAQLKELYDRLNPADEAGDSKLFDDLPFKNGQKP